MNRRLRAAWPCGALSLALSMATALPTRAQELVRHPYLQRMGPSVCAGCQFDPASTTGETACPLNHLYWDFLERQRDRLRTNVRMGIPLAALKRLAPAVMDDHRAQAARWRDRALGTGIAAPTTRKQPERG